MDKLYKSKEKAFSDLKKGILVWQNLSEHLKDNESFLLELVDRLNAYFINKKITDFFNYVSPRLRKDKNFILKICYKSPALLYNAELTRVDDLEIALFLLNNILAGSQDVGDILNCFTARILDHQEIGILVANKFPKYILFLGPRLLEQKSIIDIFVKNDPLSLQHIPEYWKNNKQFVLELVECNGMALKHASEGLKNDKDVVLAAVKNKGLSLEFASNNLKDDLDVAYAAIKNNLYAVAYVSERIKGKEYLYLYDNVLFKAWQNSADNINYNNLDLMHLVENMPEEFKKDKQIFFVFIARNYRNVQYLPDELKNDITFMTELVTKHPLCLKFFDKKYRNNKALILEAVNKLGICLEYASARLKNDREVVLSAIRNQSSALAYASKKLQDNEEIVIEAVKKYGSALEFASPRLKTKKEIYIIALETDAHAIRFLPEDVIKDRKFITTIFENNPRCAVNLVNLVEYEDLVLSSVEQLPNIIFYLENYISNPKFALAALCSMTNILNKEDLLPYFEKFPETIRDDEEIALFMYKTNQSSRKYFSSRLQKKWREFQTSEDFILYLEKATLTKHLNSEMKEKKEAQFKMKI